MPVVLWLRRLKVSSWRASETTGNVKLHVKGRVTGGLIHAVKMFITQVTEWPGATLHVIGSVQKRTN